MTDQLGAGSTAGCPPWCHVEHERGRAVNLTCSGEVLWHNDCAAVEMAQYRGNDFVVLLAYGKNEKAVGANLTLDEARELRDALDSALANRPAA